MKRCSGVLAAVGGLLLLPATAQAHGIGAADPNRPVAEYLWLGFKHLLAGWDHLLFILAIVLVAGGLWRATKLMSLFVLGHSITLMLATTQEWAVSTTLVDVVIALSVLGVAVVGLRGRPRKWTPFGIALVAVGLVHGLGLGTRLLELGVSDENLGLRVLMFNVGIEAGQAVAVVAFFALGALLTRAWHGRERARRPTYAALGLAGSIGASVIFLTSLGGGDAADAVAAEGCRTETSVPPTALGGGHPAKDYFGPEEVAPVEDLQHVIGDGYVIVRYRPDLPAADHAAIERLVTSSDPKAVIAAADPAQAEPLKAIAAERTLTCAEPALDELASFRDAWFDELKARG